MAKSKIQWTEHTANVVVGCNRVSPGCDHCYAITMSKRLEAMGQEKYKGLTKQTTHRDSADWTGKINFDLDALKKEASRKKPTMFFVPSMGDLFHSRVPFEFIYEVITIMVNHPQHTYQILTKRPERLLAYCEYEANKIKQRGLDSVDGKYFEFPDFIWMGVSVENQEMADKRIPILLQVPAKVRWLSVEPMLGRINLSMIKYGDYLCNPLGHWKTGNFFLNKDGEIINFNFTHGVIHWVVCGAESGPKARPMELKWAIDIKNQCKAAGVKFFMKQICENGRKIPYENFPSELKIREYPV